MKMNTFDIRQWIGEATEYDKKQALEIFSPGGLMDGGSIQDMDIMNMSSRRRNPILADVFSRLKYMERRGSGFKKILSAYKEHDGYTEGMNPTFSTPHDSFVLTLPKFKIEGVQGVFVDDTEQGGQTAQETTENTTEKTTQNTTPKRKKTTQKPLNATQKKIIEYLKDHPTATRLDIAVALGDITEDGVKFNIGLLQRYGILKREGGRKVGHWEIINPKPQNRR